MQQSLLALAAVLAFSTYALTRHRADHDVERHAMGTEAAVAAADIARARMAQYERYAFDEEDVERTGIRQFPPSSAIGPDGGEGGPDAYDDIDDWDGYTERVPYVLGVDSLHLDLSVSVQYVVPTDPSTPSPVPTLAKVVTVHVREAGAGATAGRQAAQTTLRRLMTPAGIATFNSGARTSSSSR